MASSYRPICGRIYIGYEILASVAPSLSAPSSRLSVEPELANGVADFESALKTTVAEAEKVAAEVEASSFQ